MYEKRVERSSLTLSNPHLSLGKMIMRPIKKPSVKNFSYLNKPAVTKDKQSKKALNIDRQIFSRLIVIAQVRDINLPHILEYEPASVPLTLFHIDGHMSKSTKADSITVLEKDVRCLTELPRIECETMTVIDFMMLIRMICTDKLQCTTFGDLSTTLLFTILSPKTKYIAVVGDNYTNDISIKAGERARRCGSGIQMQEIHNPTVNTPLPKQRRKMLSNPQNKSNLENFLMTEWTKPASRYKIPEGHQLFLSGGFKDPRKVILCT